MRDNFEREVDPVDTLTSDSVTRQRQPDTKIEIAHTYLSHDKQNHVRKPATSSSRLSAANGEVNEVLDFTSFSV